MLDNQREKFLKKSKKNSPGPIQGAGTGEISPFRPKTFHYSGPRKSRVFAPMKPGNAKRAQRKAKRAKRGKIRKKGEKAGKRPKRGKTGQISGGARKARENGLYLRKNSGKWVY